MAQKTTIDAINAFIVGCKTDGVWDKITEAYLMAGVNFDGITVKLKGTGTLTNNNFVSGDYLPTGTGAGLKGDGSTKTIDANFTVNTAVNVGLSDYRTVADTSGSNSTISACDFDGRDGVALGRFTGGSIEAFTAGDGSRLQVSTPASAGLFIGSSESLSSRVLYKNGTLIGSSNDANSEMSTSRQLTLFDALNFHVRSEARLAFAHFGTGLTDTDASNLSNRVNTLMTALGCNVY